MTRPRGGARLLDKPFTGDFDAMVKRRLIGGGVVFNLRTSSTSVQRGISYESIKLFEDEINVLQDGPSSARGVCAVVTGQLFPALEGWSTSSRRP
jgi:hypothetical protein